MDNLITISKRKLNSILNKHEMWLLNDPKGERADLHGADLRGAELRRAKLSGENLRRGADLREAKLDWPLVCQEKGSFIGYKKNVETILLLN